MSTRVSATTSVAIPEDPERGHKIRLAVGDRGRSRQPAVAGRAGKAGNVQMLLVGTRNHGDRATALQQTLCLVAPPAQKVGKSDIDAGRRRVDDRLPGGRADVRERSTAVAMHLVRRVLTRPDPA